MLKGEGLRLKGEELRLKGEGIFARPWLLNS